MDILSQVAYLHGESFDTISKILRYKANGYKGDYIHPRFIACLIRLGDLLDFDNNRFNEFSIETLKELPETSQLHKQKHASVKHMLVSPDVIEAELDCSSEEVYRVARHWFDMLESEVDLQSREWTNIAPKDLSGLPPIISRNSIKIYFNGQEADSEMLNVKFTISPKKMFNILQGGAIYQEPGFAFIREIVQNALDASKLQLWKDISDGIYDLQLDGKSAEEIKYPDDIPQSIYSQYPIHLDIKWTDKTRDSITVTCSDRGVGISEATLLRMTNFVGESHKKDEGYLTTLKTTPFWLKPTAAFGVGLQSVFFVNKKFIVNTKANGSKAMKIIFRSAADDNYCSVLNSDQTKRGTSVEVVIKEERFRELFGGNFSWSVLDHVDVFSEQGDEKYLFKIDEYIRSKISSVENFNFIPKIEGCPEIYYEKNMDEECGSIEYVEYDNFKIGYYYEGDIIVFNIIERDYGSIMHLQFCKTVNSENSYTNKLKLRGVDISSAKLNYLKTSYMEFTWDLHNESSDKIVDLSRDKLLPRGVDWVIEKLLRNLLPKFMPVIVDLFNNKILKEKESISDSEQYQRFFAIITAKMFGCVLDANASTGALSGVELQSNFVTDNTLKYVACDNFISSKCIFLVTIYGEYLKSKGNNINEVKEEIMNAVQISEGGIVVWETPNDRGLFHNYFRFTYTCVEELEYNEKFRVRKLHIVDKAHSEYKYVKFNDSQYYLSKQADSFNFFSGSRSTIYPIEEYKHIVVWNRYISGFEHFPNFANCSIYLPFSNNCTFKGLYDEIKDSDEEYVDKYLRENINKYVPQTMIARILENSVIPEETTADLVLVTYIQLIKDIVRAFENNTQR
ncbi:MAG: hypothetical protein SNG90_09370 [Rikenellaceae bacterium]